MTGGSTWPRSLSCMQTTGTTGDDQELFTVKASQTLVQTLFSANRTVQVLALLCIPQLPTKVELDKPPTLEETIKAIDKLKPCKAAGLNSIPPEIWKYGGPTLNSKLCELLVSCWEKGKLPQNLHNAVINTLYKNLGD